MSYSSPSSNGEHGLVSDFVSTLAPFLAGEREELSPGNRGLSPRYSPWKTSIHDCTNFWHGGLTAPFFQSVPVHNRRRNPDSKAVDGQSQKHDEHDSRNKAAMPFCCHLQTSFP